LNVMTNGFEYFFRGFVFYKLYRNVYVNKKLLRVLKHLSFFPQIDAEADERYDVETTTLGKNVTVAKYIAWIGQELETKSVLHSFVSVENRNDILCCIYLFPF